MERREFNREFKLELVKLVRERGVTVAQAARDLDVQTNVLRKWVREAVSDPGSAFPGHGTMKPEHQEIERPRRRGLPRDDGQQSMIAGNVLERQFNADVPNPKWVADFTYIRTAAGWPYVAAVIDLFSRRVVGWSMKAEMTAQLVTDALMMAIWRRPQAAPTF